MCRDAWRRCEVLKIGVKFQGMKTRLFFKGIIFGIRDRL